MKVKHFVLIGILATLGLTQSVAMAQAAAAVAPSDDYASGPYKVVIGSSRPASPYAKLANFNTSLTQTGSGPDYPIESARHHIIPYNAIRDFFNRLWQSPRQTALASKYLTMLGNHIPEYARIGRGNAASADQASTFAKRLGSGYVKPGGTLTAPGSDDFLEYVAWMPGNLFLGPEGTFRTDDPQSGFEINAKYVIGQKRFDTLVAIRDGMTAYQTDPSDARVIEILRNLESVAQITRVQPLENTDWVKTGTNRYAINTRNPVPATR